jgi:hypothetical protein
MNDGLLVKTLFVREIDRLVVQRQGIEREQAMIFFLSGIRNNHFI